MAANEWVCWPAYPTPQSSTDCGDSPWFPRSCQGALEAASEHDPYVPLPLIDLSVGPAWL